MAPAQHKGAGYSYLNRPVDLCARPAACRFRFFRDGPLQTGGKKTMKPGDSLQPVPRIQSSMVLLRLEDKRRNKREIERCLPATGEYSDRVIRGI